MSVKLEQKIERLEHLITTLISNQAQNGVVSHGQNTPNVVECSRLNGSNSPSNQVFFENSIPPNTSKVMAKKLQFEKEDLMPYTVPKTTYLYQRKDLRWEAKVTMPCGTLKSVKCCRSKGSAYRELKKVYNENKQALRQTRKVETDFTLHKWLDHWHALYRMPKHENNELSENTIKSDQSSMRKIKKVFKDIKLKDIKADMIQGILAEMTQRRTAEQMYSVLKLALTKAKDYTGGRNIMENVEMIKHRRVGGRALTQNEIDTLLSGTDNETEKDIIRVYVLTGVRVDELTRIHVGHVNLSDESRFMTGLKFHGKDVPDMEVKPNELFVYGTKTKLSIRTMPITPKLKPILERLIKDRDGDEKLFKHTVAMIRNFHRAINERLAERKTPIKYTLKDYRHTCTTNYKDAGIPSLIYAPWFGWSDDTMAKRVYTHKTNYEREQAQEWASKFV